MHLTNRIAGMALIGVTFLAPGCVTWSQGLAPVRPRYGDVLEPDAPLLEWKPAAEPADETRYDVAVFDASGANVYQVDDLSEPRHIVTAPLAPGKYQWTVRPAFRRGDQWTRGAANARKYFYFAVVLFGWGTQPYEFFVKQPLIDATPTASAAGL
jgi:hypothetical protein